MSMDPAEIILNSTLNGFWNLNTKCLVFKTVISTWVNYFILLTGIWFKSLSHM